MATVIVSTQPARKPMPQWTDEPWVGKSNALVIHAHSKSEAISLAGKHFQKNGGRPERIKLVRKP